MILLLIIKFIQSKSSTFSFDCEISGELQTNDSPTTLNIKKGFGLIITVWPDATIKISIPGIISSPIILTKEDKYSVFTFANDASVEITFQTSVKFSQFKCPQYKSLGNVLHYVSNVPNPSFSLDDGKFDTYFSLFGLYSIKGSIKTNNVGSPILYYQKYPSTDITSTTELSQLNLINVGNTSSIIRRRTDDVISFSNLQFDSFDKKLPSVNSMFILYWESVEGNQNNFHDNSAYGGIVYQDFRFKQITNSWNDKSYTINIEMEEDFLNILALEMDYGKGKSFVTPKSSMSFGSPLTASFYLTSSNGACSSKFYKQVPIDQIGEKTVTFSLSDVPSECIDNKTMQTYYVKIQNGISSQIPMAKVIIKDSDQKTTLNSGQIYSKSLNDTKPFSVEVYVKTMQCSETKLFDVTAQAQNPTSPKIIVDSDVPSQCISQKYEVCADLSKLSSKYSISYTVSYDESVQHVATHGINKLSYNHPFSVHAYLTSSPGCSGNYDLGLINAEPSFTCLSVTKDSLPNECTQGDDDDDSSSFFKSKTFMIILICGVVLVVAVIIIVVIIVIQKKKKNTLNSTSLQSNLMNNDFIKIN